MNTIINPFISEYEEHFFPVGSMQATTLGPGNVTAQHHMHAHHTKHLSSRTPI